MTAPEPAPRWSWPTRIAFRFAFVYLVLYLPIATQGGFPFTNQLYQWLVLGWNEVVAWTGHHVLHLAGEIATQQTGSGDRTWDWVQIFCIAALAVFGAAVWTALAFRRPSHPHLHEWLRIAVRYVLALSLLMYGLAKVFPGQFAFPPAYWLVQTLGDSSPMRLLWAFMGYSKPYTIFAGVSEVLGGLLLLWRRTTSLGALVALAVMANVMMMNYCYDVPVKLLSTHLVALSLFLLLPDARRLCAVLVQGARRRRRGSARPSAARSATASPRSCGSSSSATCW